MENRIKIYFTSDLHGYFFSTDYGDREQKAMGLFQCANQFQKDKNTLVIDGGDILQGSALAYYCQKQLNSCKPIAQMMNLCRYDYITLGNHDFNYGQSYLKEYINELDAVCVCENVKDINNSYQYPYDIKVMENGIKVGIVGIVTDYVNVWERPENIEGLVIADPYLEAKRVLEVLKENVDITLCIYHGGFERNLETNELLSKTSENIGYRIANELDFDILFTAHQHMSIEGRYLNGTYVLQTKDKGVEYQEVVVCLEEKRVTIQSTLKKAGTPYSAYSTPFEVLEKEVQVWLDERVGQLEKSILPEEKIQMAANGNEIAVFLNQIQLYYSKAQISAVSLANQLIGFNQEVTRREVIANYPYPNTLVVLEISGDDLKKAIERSAEYFEIDEKGNKRVANKFLMPKEEHYNYDYYEGIEYKINTHKKEGERVVFLQYQNKDITMADKFTICINNYRASGTGGYEMYQHCKIIKEINVEMQELILDYFEMNKNKRIALPNKRLICF
jgi:2',3'-cyclic-nucleotide 2'-phosphodiesterase / 3'-nucleotidase